MPLIADEELKAVAVPQADEHLGKMLSAEIQTEWRSGSTQWDPTLRRHVYTQMLQVWTTYDTVKMRVDNDGRVVSFADANRFETGPPASLQKVSPDELLKIVGTTGLLDGSARVTRTVPTGGAMLSVTVEQPGAEWPVKLSATVNTKSRLVAAFDVLPGEQ